MPLYWFFSQIESFEIKLSATSVGPQRLQFKTSYYENDINEFEAIFILLDNG